MARMPPWAVFTQTTHFSEQWYNEFWSIIKGHQSPHLACVGLSRWLDSQWCCFHDHFWNNCFLLYTLGNKTRCRPITPVQGCQQQLFMFVTSHYTAGSIIKIFGVAGKLQKLTHLFQGMRNVLSFDACSTVRGSSADDPQTCWFSSRWSLILARQLMPFHCTEKHKSYLICCCCVGYLCMKDVDTISSSGYPEYWSIIKELYVGIDRALLIMKWTKTR